MFSSEELLRIMQSVMEIASQINDSFVLDTCMFYHNFDLQSAYSEPYLANFSFIEKFKMNMKLTDLILGKTDKNDPAFANKTGQILKSIFEQKAAEDLLIIEGTPVASTSDIKKKLCHVLVHLNKEEFDNGRTYYFEGIERTDNGVFRIQWGS
jgi:hypothetical protein